MESIKQARQTIEYFAQYFDDNFEIKKVFESGLEEAKFKSVRERQ